ncbi:hypothetical protein [Brachybacterium phenoliresistens]|nr:hypothetical protein [Brachybacterium phenoliresistens]
MGITIVYAFVTLLVAGGIVGATALPRLRKAQEETRHSSRTHRES